MLVDPLSVTEMLIVAGVGAVIVMYSIGYMHGDPKERRFFVYLDLFLFSMLLLVMAANFVLLLAGWGLVGLSSYLLIGFWHERPEPVAAAKKAFVMNAIGDVGIAIADLLHGPRPGHDRLRDGVPAPPRSTGRRGRPTPTGSRRRCWSGRSPSRPRSRSTPGFPDAMEGPTPVSALIHAATMVTAGVYLVARTHVLFENAPDIQALVALLGLATLLMAGVIALVQTDIKRIIAYSTMSQIGYMFTAVGVGAYSAGMFLLLAHAFFKALLFLGAGIVIHALGGEQDVRRMGGLGSALPKTKWLMWIGTVALIGFWPFSKDEVLAAALAEGRRHGRPRLGRRPRSARSSPASTPPGSCGSRSTASARSTRPSTCTRATARPRGRCSGRWPCWPSGTRARGLPRDRVRVQQHVLRVARERRAVDRAVHRRGPA